MNKNSALCALLWSTILTGTAAQGHSTARQESTAGKTRTIATIEPVSVESPAGWVPRLPYRLWVNYSDGYGEYRQVKWLNAGEATERAQADTTRHPAGNAYSVRGFVTGDNATASGYPVTAQVRVATTAPTPPPPQPIAATLPLDQVDIEGDNRLTWNRDLDIDHLLSLPVRQQLYNFRDTYGLPTEGYPVADGWDSPTTKLKGHGAGHYMSAMAMAFACCHDTVKKAALRNSIKLMVDGLRQCQERTFVWSDSLGRYWEARDLAPDAELQQMEGTWGAFDRYKRQYRVYGYGYLNAIPPQHCALVEAYRPYNNESGVWAPYYSIHKQLAGLIDIATYIDDRATADKALLTAKDMGLWVWNRLHYRTYTQSSGSQQQRRQRPGNRYEMWNMYIAGEVGGMSESLARLAEMTGTPEEKKRLIEAANCFDSQAFFDPLAHNIDAIRTRHANQHIPMVTGALRTYRANGNPYYYHLAENFWTMVQGRYRYATGGVGNGEMFRQPYAQITAMCTNVSSYGGRLTPEPTINETCCAYNLAKLTKDLNAYNPDDARYMDYYERVLYNQIVGSLNPRQYQTVYQYAVGLNASKPWGNETPQSSCCGGTGAENHVKYQEAAYFVSIPAATLSSDATLWVALYMPTTAHWQQQDAVIRQECLWPAERSIITVAADTGAPRRDDPKFAMKLRVPYWATQGFSVKLNGRNIDSQYQPSSYVEIAARHWLPTDTVEVVMPFTKHIDFGPDKMQTAATPGQSTATDYPPQWAGTLMYGPLVMATTGITTWSEATVNVAADLSDVAAHAPTPGSGAYANLYTLSLGDRTFMPDYAGDSLLTHYLRIDMPADSAAAALANSAATDPTELNELLLMAQHRHDEQQAWQALSVKVPEYAPWAVHGYSRMVRLMEAAQRCLDASQQRYCSQQDIDKCAAALSAAINSMRPGNLPEPEDLEPLQHLLEQARRLPNANQQASQAIDYAMMVIRYVSDGSGTTDMIERATRQLTNLLAKKQ